MEEFFWDGGLHTEKEGEMNETEKKLAKVTEALVEDYPELKEALDQVRDKDLGEADTPLLSH